jgi:nitroreductase
MDVLSAISGRISTRAYLDKPVPRQLVQQVMDTARWAPSGTNTQPWQVVAVDGAARQAISAALRNHVVAGGEPTPHYDYYPAQFAEPYKGRRWRCGMQLYAALGVAADDRPARQAAMLRNYDFFGAPVGLFFYLDRVMGKGSWLDMGMFIQNVMLAARGVGLDTCPQFALAMYPDVVARHVPAPEGYDLICGLSVGYADPSAAVNRYRTERMQVAELLTWAE